MGSRTTNRKASQPIQVRTARPEDRDGIVAMLLEMDGEDGGSRREEMRDAPIGAALRSVSPPAIVATHRDTVVGLLLFHRVLPALLQPGSLFVEELFVRSEHRRRGIGARLIDEVQRLAAREGRVRVDLIARRGNSDGLAFYDRMGAQRFDDVEWVRFEVEPTGRLGG